jgi:hypothetical protein
MGVAIGGSFVWGALYTPASPLISDHAPTVQSQSESLGQRSLSPTKGTGNDEAFEIPYIGIKTGEALLALFTLLLWWSTRDLVLESRKTAERQLRAYISVEIGQFTLQNKVLRFEFRPVIVNNGETPASNVMIGSKLALVPPIIPPNFDYSVPKPDLAFASAVSWYEAAHSNHPSVDLPQPMQLGDILRR